MLFPTQATLSTMFPSLVPPAPQPHTTPLKSYDHLYPIASMSDKASALSHEAQAELQKASKIAQEKTGAIPPYSTKYYAACVIGGLLACVGI